MPEKLSGESAASALLKNIHVAKPCAESWEQMAGTDRVRSCERCQHRVYNLSEMTEPEAADLLRKAEGRLCVRFYRRADGTVMTKDCPVGLAAVRQRAARAAAVAFTSVAVACGASYMGKPRSEQPRWVQWVMNRLAPEPEPIRPTVGAIALPMAPVTPTMGTPAPPPPPRAEVIGKVAVAPPHTMGEIVMERPVVKKK